MIDPLRPDSVFPNVEVHRHQPGQTQDESGPCAGVGHRHRRVPLFVVGVLETDAANEERIETVLDLGRDEVQVGERAQRSGPGTAVEPHGGDTFHSHRTGTPSTVPPGDERTGKR